MILFSLKHLTIKIHSLNVDSFKTYLSAVFPSNFTFERHRYRKITSFKRMSYLLSRLSLNFKILIVGYLFSPNNFSKVFDAKINCSTRACYYRIRFVISSFHFIPVAHMTTSVNKCYYSVA